MLHVKTFTADTLAECFSLVETTHYSPAFWCSYCAESIGLIVPENSPVIMSVSYRSNDGFVPIRLIEVPLTDKLERMTLDKAIEEASLEAEEHGRIVCHTLYELVPRLAVVFLVHRH